MTGIALSGWDRLGWSGGAAERWMRLRDRQSLLAAILLCAGYLALALWLVLKAWQGAGGAGPAPISAALSMLMTVNLGLLLALAVRALHGRRLWRAGGESRYRGDFANVCWCLPLLGPVALPRAQLGGARWDKTRTLPRPAAEWELAPLRFRRLCRMAFLRAPSSPRPGPRLRPARPRREGGRSPPPRSSLGPGRRFDRRTAFRIVPPGWIERPRPGSRSGRGRVRLCLEGLRQRSRRLRKRRRETCASSAGARRPRRTRRRARTRWRRNLGGTRRHAGPSPPGRSFGGRFGAACGGGLLGGSQAARPSTG